MTNPTLRLDGKKILITGVSRERGIGATLAKRLAEAGATIAVHGYSDYDMAVHLPHTTMPNGTEKLAKQLSNTGLKVVAVTSSDLEKPGAAETAVEEAVAKLGGLDGLILNHAYSTHAPIGEWTAEHIDSHLLVNVRAAMMMIQSFVAQVDTTKDNAITLFTSGQQLSPMFGEMAYCVSKEATISLCRQSSYMLGDKNIRVNCVNPGPNDTDYCSDEVLSTYAKKFPAGRWGTPDDTADLVLFLHSSYAKWITGQVITSDGGVKEYWK